MELCLDYIFSSNFFFFFLIHYVSFSISSVLHPDAVDPVLLFYILMILFYIPLKRKIFMKGPDHFRDSQRSGLRWRKAYESVGFLRSVVYSFLVASLFIKVWRKFICFHQGLTSSMTDRFYWFFLWICLTSPSFLSISKVCHLWNVGHVLRKWRNIFLLNYTMEISSELFLHSLVFTLVPISNISSKRNFER